MAYICEKPKGACQSCGHYRFDEDRQRMACFAQKDESIPAVNGIDTDNSFNPDIIQVDLRKTQRHLPKLRHCRFGEEGKKLLWEKEAAER